MEGLRQPPGTFMQRINKLVHTPPFSFLFYGTFWSTFLVIFSPLAGLALLIMTGWQFCQYIFLWPFGVNKNNKIDPKKIANSTGGRRTELAVLITGCGSGFGCNLALALAQKGFVVFAGCRSEKSRKQFESIDKVVPLKMDITVKKEVEEGLKEISLWLAEGQGTERYLHALVNNAGVGRCFRLDWEGIEPFRQSMEVNYFGTIQVTQACLPILKAQACSQSYTQGRIINVGSILGLSAGAEVGPYAGSKHAFEAFSTTLRHELLDFGIKVSTINPSYHRTNMVDTHLVRQNLNERWDRLDKGTKDEYGEEFYKQMHHNAANVSGQFMWDAGVAVDQLVLCVETTKLPPQLAIGADAKFMVLVLRHLPVWMQDFIVCKIIMCNKIKPAAMPPTGFIGPRK